ncbi:MAG: phenylacetate--CoA ligase family protein [Chloroflexota bacterium]|nr:MAG: phenylacetate--CoA ligase family protein [Chloroflexota bacterium]
MTASVQPGPENRATEGIGAAAETVVRHFMAWAFGLGRNAWLLPLDLTFRFIGIRYGWLKALFVTMPPALLRLTGRLRAERAAWRAIKRVPAYRAHLRAAGIDHDRLPPAGILEAIPETDKRSYIDLHPLAERCVDGRIRFKGVTIDESSGSTGTPYNWIRGAAERNVAQRNIAFFARYAFGDEELVTLNGFSMGAWATGITMSQGMVRHGLVKSIGPDIGKILASLRVLGPSVRYLISGYPPFLKHLLDEGEREGFPWPDYRLSAIVGGEGMTEELRDRLLERFDVVYSGYGATDLEIGMAAESPVSVALRRLARARPDIRAALFGADPRLPMVFQYNPLIHHLEVNDLGEVLCTVSRLDLMTPRIRYNVHDAGGLLPFATVRRILAEHGIDIGQLGAMPDVAGPRGRLPWSRPIPLPFVFIYGRRDATISVMGANIYPEDIETIVYGNPALARRLQSFLLTGATDADGTPRPAIALELIRGEAPDDAWAASLVDFFRDGLQALNADFREALGEFPAAMQPVVTLHQTGAGPFADDAGRIKPRRLIPPA